ncbi:hypothetical protein LX69_03337 [Breznakibacter xylanolyticus]|uniref:Uncharacterized protein n=1 Tax=Breznakibacter xylanolyticus TaxID=990 RepID=A0A2W7MSU0_9BACT|nr:hypothetical protein [Breznakibacter xylanolyticus]PZX10613.1 hypothetical protein LX69_03337 [Breznakibacter xylanolyticus]
MIAEENFSSCETPFLSISSRAILPHIHMLMKQAIPCFINYIHSENYKKKNLNEDDLTQIYIEQAQILIRKHNYPFNVNGQYRDITNLSKGFSDFYFFPNELGVSTNSIYSVESKRLPAPDKFREKEYVIGNNKNGGIERYKNQIHGKGLNECGLIGFVEKHNFKYWLDLINSWIEDLALSNRNWNEEERLLEIESHVDFCFLHSKAKREEKDIELHHFWIELGNGNSISNSKK